MVGVGEGPFGWAELHSPLTPHPSPRGKGELLEKGHIRAPKVPRPDQEPLLLRSKSRKVILTQGLAHSELSWWLSYNTGSFLRLEKRQKPNQLSHPF